MLSGIYYILAVIAIIWVIYDVVANQKKMSTGKKVLWIVLGIIFNVFAAIAYFLIEKR